MPADRMHLDYETYSGIDLPKVGLDRYSRDRTSEVLMAAYSVNDTVRPQWVPAEGMEIPREFKQALESPDVIKWAWNAPFEMAITRHVLGIDTPLESWRDTMVLALTCSLPGKLEKAGPVVDLPDDKVKSAKGKRLIKKFSTPRKPTARDARERVFWYDDLTDWHEFLDYNGQDEVSERAIYHRLAKFSPPQHEWELWHLDQEINRAGIPINMAMVRNAIRLYESTVKIKLDEMREITGLANPNSPPQLLPWLQANGYPFSDLQKGHIARALERAGDDGDAAYQEVLSLRAETSRTSPKKYHALLRAADDKDGVLRYSFQFAGAARTWRWGGRLYQPQNLPRPVKALEKRLEDHARNVEKLPFEAFDAIYTKPMDVLSSCIRPVAQAPDGYLFIDADLNAIENRVLGWLSGCEKILRVFRLKRDPYIDFGTYLFDASYEELWKEYKAGDSSKRTISKPGVLGCLRGDTPVMTPRGWVRLLDLRHDDLVFDGEEWVSHNGVAYMGVKPTLSLAGIHATEDHKFDVFGEWRTCQSVIQQNDTCRALASAVGKLSDTLVQLGLQAQGIGADATAAWSKKLGEGISLLAAQACATPALKRTEGALRESASVPLSTKPSQVVSMLRKGAVKTHTMPDIVTTESGEFVVGSIAPKSGLPTCVTISTPRSDFQKTRLSKLTVGTTTETTSRGISGSQHDLKMFTTAEPVWDVIDAGPRARFVIMTEDGPMISSNCGYMLGAGEEKINRDTGEREATGLLGYAWNMGVKQFTVEQSKLSVDTFRREFEEVKDYWYGIERAAKRCIRTGKPVDFGHIRFDKSGPFMRMILPSGRALHYCRPRIESVKAPWGEMKDSITYETMNDKKQWKRESTHPGKLTENADQAIARDLLANGMKLAKKRGLKIRMHVHDQIVALSPEDRAEEQLKILLECMEEQPSWGRDLPLGAEGHVSKMFMKD